MGNAGTYRSHYTGHSRSRHNTYTQSAHKSTTAQILSPTRFRRGFSGGGPAPHTADT